MIQQAQLQHRLELVAAFGIQKGMRVLEIGCGQGDTTVAIADAVGESGSVVAIDIANPDYGAPLTLGQAAERIKKSSLGERIDFILKWILTFMNHLYHLMWRYYPIVHGISRNQRIY